LRRRRGRGIVSLPGIPHVLGGRVIGIAGIGCAVCDPLPGWISEPRVIGRTALDQDIACVVDQLGKAVYASGVRMLALDGCPISSLDLRRRGGPLNT
jgi:hypothetical protein